MTDIEKLEYARMFLDKLANGINPLDNTPVAENELVNHVRISRCFFYVSDVLRQVIEERSIPKSKAPKLPFSVTHEQLAAFPYSETPIPVSEFTSRINALVSEAGMKKFCYKLVTGWLISIGALCELPGQDGKVKKQPTETGNELGIYAETRNGLRGTYSVILYSKAAQEFLIEHFDAILAYEQNPDK